MDPEATLVTVPRSLTRQEKALTTWPTPDRRRQISLDLQGMRVAKAADLPLGPDTLTQMKAIAKVLEDSGLRTTGVPTEATGLTNIAISCSVCSFSKLEIRPKRTPLGFFLIFNLIFF